MATYGGRTNTTVKKSLPEQALENPSAFDFDQLAYVIEAINVKAAQFGDARDPLKEALRVRANPVMHQEVGEVSHLETGNTLSGLPEVYTNFLNLIGVNGALPMPYTESILERIKAKDKAALHFLDIFHHRLAGLLHKARKKSYPHLYKTIPERTPIGKIAESLSGFKALPDLPHTVFFDYYWRRPRSIYALLHMIKGFFSLDATVTPFEGAWRAIEKDEGTLIGTRKGQFNALGQTSVLGLRSWDQAAGFSIRLPALGFEAATGFLPFQKPELGGANFKRLKKLALGFMGCQPKVFLKIRLKAEENDGAVLNGKFALGWNAWLKGGDPDIASVRLL